MSCLLLDSEVYSVIFCSSEGVRGTIVFEFAELLIKSFVENSSSNQSKLSQTKRRWVWRQQIDSLDCYRFHKRAFVYPLLVSISQLKRVELEIRRSKVSIDLTRLRHQFKRNHLPVNCFTLKQHPKRITNSPPNFERLVFADVWLNSETILDNKLVSFNFQTNSRRRRRQNKRSFF